LTAWSRQHEYERVRFANRQLPVTPVRDASGEWVRLKYSLPGFDVWVRAWQARVGRAMLYLLDSNDPANPPVVRGVTSELYGGARSVQ